MPLNRHLFCIITNSRANLLSLINTLRPYCQQLDHFARPLTAFAWLLWWASLPLSKGIASAAMVALCILGLLRWTAYPPDWSEAWQTQGATLLFIGIFVAFVLGLGYTDNLREGLDFTFRQNTFLSVPLLFVVYARYLPDRLPRHLVVFIVATLLVGIISLILYKLPEAQAVALTQRLGWLPYPQGSDIAASGLHSPFIARIQYANLVALAALSACWLLATTPHSTYRYAYIAALLGLLIVMLYMGARGAQIGCWLAMAIWLAAWGIRRIYPPLARRIGRVGATLSLGLGLTLSIVGLPYIAYSYVPEVQKRYERMRWEIGTYRDGTYKNYDNYGDFTSLTRILSWQKNIDLIRQHPYAGTGTGDYYDALQIELNANGSPVKLYAHNQFLQTWAMLGLWGLLLMLAVWGYWLINACRKTAYPTNVLALSVAAFYLPVCLTDSALISQAGGMGFMLFVASIPLLSRRTTRQNAQI